MNEQTTEQPSKTRRVTDAALIIIAIAAVAAWLWRRVRSGAIVDHADETSEIQQTVDDKVGAAVGFPTPESTA